MPGHACTSLLVGICLVASPLPSFADYLIQLKNGRQIITPSYRYEDQEVIFDVGNGSASIKAHTIASITHRKIEGLVERPGGDAGTRPEKRTGPPSPAAQKEPTLSAYKQKKDDIVLQIDGALEKYREALSSQDGANQERLQQEITALSKQVFDLTDEVKRQNKGQLPEGWGQY